jgi:hypothetical protein
MEEWYLAWTGIDTGGYTGVVNALSTQMGDFYAGNEHENSHPGGFRPDLAFMMQ